MTFLDRAVSVNGLTLHYVEWEIAKTMLERLPDGRLVEVEGAGHMVPGDRPREFARVVCSFLDV